ncbi:DMT family transporter [Myroides sp. LJL119]
MQQTSSLSQLQDNNQKGWVNGFIGVLLFSGSMPFTKMAVIYFDPIFTTAARAGIAGILAAICLWYFKQPLPKNNQIFPIFIVALGAVIGFPLLSAMALQYISSAHSLVFLGMLPMCTAIFAVFLAKEKPSKLFWFFSTIGALLVIGYAARNGLQSSIVGEGLMLGAIVLCGWSYAKGAILSKTLGGWQVISWALVICLPISLPAIFLQLPPNIQTINPLGYLGIAYIGVISMFVGFIFWYKGLSQGGIAKVGQLQLLQPFFGMALAGILLHEQIDPIMIGVTLGIILCVALSKKYA